MTRDLKQGYDRSVDFPVVVGRIGSSLASPVVRSISNRNVRDIRAILEALEPDQVPRPLRLLPAHVVLRPGAGE